MRNLKYILSTLQGINRNLVIVLVLTFAFTACVQEEPYSPYESNAAVRYTIVAYQSTTLSGATNGDPALSWQLKVTEGNEFCSVETPIGRVGKPFSLKFANNDSGEKRTAEVEITFSDGFSKTFTIRQLAKTAHPAYDRAWGEQPDFKDDGSTTVYKSYYTNTVTGEKIRNYSICYDTEKLVSHWVAYPVHSCYLGNSGRTDRWSFDDYYYTPSGSGYKAEYIPTEPVIPQSQQWVMTSTYGGGYARGHILPSASRLSNYNTNAQTFYSTNIMPQAYDFNGGAWLQIENKVRDWKCNDTLFVVTGTLFEGTNGTLTKNDRTVTIPSHCYKVLLRTKSGRSGKNIMDITSADELQCIGFLYKNSNSETRSPRNAAVSVSEIENRTGFVFFRNLDPSIALEVKSQKNLSDWGL